MWDAFKDTKPRKAAAAIVIDSAGEVLLAQRNTTVNFMGGHHVFPGGRIDDSDALVPVLHAESAELAAAMAAAARELFEESGVLLAASPHGQARETLRAARAELLAGKTTFAAILSTFNAQLDARNFTPAGLWVTPPFSPIRYHTRYFILRFDGERMEEASSPEGEIVALDWLHPREARRRWHAGSIKISVPVAFVLQHLAAGSPDSVLEWLRRTPDEDQGRPHRFELRHGIHMMPLRSATLPPATHTNTVVIGEEELILIDPAPDDPAEQQILFDHLDHLLALGGWLRAVVLTHGHPDHTGALEAVRARYGAPVWAHPATAAALGIEIERELHDGAFIDLPGDPGWRLRCLHTPGHDPGHLALLEESTGTLIAGDLIANPGTILIAPQYGGNMTDYLHSLDRLLHESFALLLPSHGIPLWGKECKPAIEGLIKHRREREQKIFDAVAGGAQTRDEVVAIAYADTPESAWPLALHQMDAHLVRLGIELEG